MWNTFAEPRLSQTGIDWLDTVLSEAAERAAIELINILHIVRFGKDHTDGNLSEDNRDSEQQTT